MRVFGEVGRRFVLCVYTFDSVRSFSKWELIEAMGWLLANTHVGHSA